MGEYRDISKEASANGLAQTKEFFEFPASVKETAPRPLTGPNRGYISVGGETLSGISGYMKGVRDPVRMNDVKVWSFLKGLSGRGIIDLSQRNLLMPVLRTTEYIPLHGL